MTLPAEVTRYIPVRVVVSVRLRWIDGPARFIHEDGQTTLLSAAVLTVFK